MLGNLPLIDKDKPTLSFIKLAEEYDYIFRIQTLSDAIIVVSGHELVAEVCDETRFDKSIEGALARFVPLLETDYLLARLTSLTGKSS